MSASTQSVGVEARKLLGVRATDEQRRTLTRAAKARHQSVSSFVLNAALQAAAEPVPKPKRTLEEMQAIIAAARAEVQAFNPTGRDLVAELIAERRAEAARE